MASATEPLLASVELWPCNFAPKDWAYCHGQLLPISQNTALFSLLGTIYGGDGTTTFALPDLRGRVPVGAGQSPGTSFYNLGQKAGSETAILTIANMPQHSHEASGSVTPNAGTGKITLRGDPTNNYPGQSPTNVYTSANNAKMGESPVTVTVMPTGGGQSFSIVQPYLALNYIIALIGIYPSRN